MRTKDQMHWRWPLLLSVFLLLLPGLFSSLNAQIPWLQKGADIDGMRVADLKGRALDISDDGSTMVVAAMSNDGPDSIKINSGQVIAYKWDGSNWVRKGQVIYGNAIEEYLGWAVSISGDGDVIAISSIHYDSPDGTINNVGKVHVYRWEEPEWVPMGSMLATVVAENDYFGWSVSLNSDGYILGVGEIGVTYDRSHGRTYIYEFDGSDWALKGNMIRGIGVGDRSGWSVSLNEDGDAIAIGAPYNKNQSNYTPGHVRVFTWEGSDWVIRGSEVESPWGSSTYRQGQSVSINASGTIFATGAKDKINDETGLTRVYRWAPPSWVLMGDTIRGLVDNEFGTRVCLDSTGHRLVIGEYEPDTDYGQLRVYDWSGTAWVQQGTAIKGDQVGSRFGASARISADGKTFAAGAYGPDSEKGLARVYYFCNNEGVDVQTACDSLVWIDGMTYKEDNFTATDTLVNADGCDSIVTLNLTIIHSNEGVDVQTACDSYTWIDGNTYTEDNNTATDTLVNADGCDSIVTLNLTIIHSSSGVDVQTACESMIWIDGNTYTEDNNTATYTLTNAAGCDSVVTLDLSILKNSSSTLDETVQDTYTSPSGKVWTESGTYYDTIPNAAGCDSVITINLVVNHTGMAELDGDDWVSCYPNPVEDMLRINFRKPFKGSIEVMSINGSMLIKETRINSRATTINTSKLPAGVYLLKVSGASKNYILRISKI